MVLDAFLDILPVFNSTLRAFSSLSGFFRKPASDSLCAGARCTVRVLCIVYCTYMLYMSPIVLHVFQNRVNVLLFITEVHFLSRKRYLLDLGSL